jgi:hypothetical protein
MEQVALRLRKTDGWTYLGGRPDARKVPEVVVRAMEGDVLFATGPDESGPEGDGVLVRKGEGRRLAGRHFFLRPAPPSGPRLVVHRGLLE